MWNVDDDVDAEYVYFRFDDVRWRNAIYIVFMTIAFQLPEKRARLSALSHVHDVIVSFKNLSSFFDVPLHRETFRDVSFVKVEF